MYPVILPDDVKRNWSYSDVFNGTSRLVKAYTHENFHMLMHCHDFYELNIVLCGSGMHYFGNSRRAFLPGDVFVIPPGSRHGYYPSRPEERVDIFHILLHENFFIRYRAELSGLQGYVLLFTLEPTLRSLDRSQRYSLRLGERLEEIRPFMDKMGALYYNDYAEADVMLNASALYIIAWLCGTCRNNGAQKQELQVLSDCIKAVGAAEPGSLTTEMLAKAASVSRSTLFRSFRRGLGMTPGDYIRLCRLDDAALRLRSGEESIADIAQNCGFFDSSHFIKAFSEHFGITPARYRRAARDNENP